VEAFLSADRTEQSAEGRMPPLDGAAAWLNSEPLVTTELRGRVVAVQFCTYTCINWLRALPPLRAWDEAYRDLGLVVIGVHSPEFSFEHIIPHVERAISERSIDYPVAIDNDFTIWRAFANHYWPALYLVDAQGRIRLRHVGEGGYDDAERVLRELLVDNRPGTLPPPVTVDAMGIEVPADWDTLRSPETYLGYRGTDGFSSPGGVRPDVPETYELPWRLRLRHWALSGGWTMGAESVVSTGVGSRIACVFHARDVHLVLSPARGEEPVRFRVLIDGQAPGRDHGSDVDAEGFGTVVEPRLYQLVRQSGRIEERTFEIEFLDAGVEAYVFTFG
jgi:hypothetical protein